MSLRQIAQLLPFVTAVILSLQAAANDSALPEVPAHRPTTLRQQESHLVHRFDFDERPTGNMENFPRYWEPLRMSGFPKFATGQFDWHIGHDAAPSFALKSEGRNVAYRYVGEEAPVHAGADYRVEGWVRIRSAGRARVCLSACYLDQRRRELLDTMARSSFLGGDSNANWNKFSFVLPPAPPSARWIGVQVWLLQESHWRVADKNAIFLSDVEATAWLDDIMIYRQPDVQLATIAPGNVLDLGGEPALRLGIEPGLGLKGTLELFDAEGQLIQTTEVEGRASRDHQLHIGTKHPGLYTAVLRLHSQATGMVERQLRFALLSSLFPNPRAAEEAIYAPDSRPSKSHGEEGITLHQTAIATSGGTHPSIKLELNPPSIDSSTHRRSGAAGSAFGLVLRDTTGCIIEELALLESQCVSTVKIPWDSTRQPDAAMLLPRLSQAGFAVTAIVAPDHLTIPAGTASDATGDIQLAAFSGSQFSAVRWWQIGAEGIAENEKVPGAAFASLRAALGRVVPSPQLNAVVGSATSEEERPELAKHATVMFESSKPTVQFPENIARLRKAGFETVSAFVPFIDAQTYHRRPRLYEWAWRVAAARHAGADFVYVPQTWDVREGPGKSELEPREELILLRTLGRWIGDARPGPAIEFADGVQALAFHRAGSSLLMIRDMQAPPQGRVHELPLGKARMQIDLWGRQTPLNADSRGIHTVRLSSAPILIEGIESWWLEFLASIRFEPTFATTGMAHGQHKILLDYKGTELVTGKLSIDPLEGIEFAPREFSFQANPGKLTEATFTAHYADNLPAGNLQLVLRITLDRDGREVLWPIKLNRGLAEIDVWGTATIEGDELVLRHTVSNRSEYDVSFRGTAGVPGRERLSRQFEHVRPGESVTCTYRVANGPELTGRRVQLALQEVGDSPRRHRIVLTVP